MLSASLIMFALRLVDLMEPATHPRSVQLWMVLPLEPALHPLESAVSSALHVEAQAVRTTPTPSFQHFPPTQTQTHASTQYARATRLSAS